MTEATTAPTPRPNRPTRADARRNYDALLNAADHAFRTHGTDTSLEDIARQAGVAIGTLYRHFPSRDDLIGAVLQDEFDALRTAGDELLGHDSPHDALLNWLDALSDHVAVYQGLAGAMLASIQDPSSSLYAARESMVATGAQLLARAQNAGTIRADIDVDHVLLLACGLTSAIEKNPSEPHHTDKLRQVLHDGLRPAV